VKTSTKVILFLALIALYLLLINLTGGTFRVFSSRFGGPGIDVYVLADFLACFWSGPVVGPMDPYPYRSTCAFIGGLSMAAVLFWKFVVLR
jgi:hypothetical protein